MIAVRKLGKLETLDLFPEPTPEPITPATQPTSEAACVLKDGHHFDPKNLPWSDGRQHCTGCGKERA